MTIDPEKYTYRVMWSEEDQEYIGLCTEFPSLSWLAASQGDVLSGITKLVADVLADMIKRKEAVPEPLSLRDFKGKIALRVPPNNIVSSRCWPPSGGCR
jgi:hypothetical protein